MAPAVSGGKTISGEGRVTYLKSNYAVLSKPNLDGGIFLVPSNLLGQQVGGYPDMNTLVSLNDTVAFKAVPQEERKGIKWQALDGSAKVVKRAAEIEYKGTGWVTFIDERQGQYGFIDSNSGKGSVWFNANVVRPETTDVGKVLKKGHQVNFVAVKQPQQQCPYRATLVYTKNYKPKQPQAKAKKATTNASGGAAKAAPLKESNNNHIWGSTQSLSSESRSSSRPSTPYNDGVFSYAVQQPIKPAPLQPVAPSSRLSPMRTQPLDIILSRESQTRPVNQSVISGGLKSSEGAAVFANNYGHIGGGRSAEISSTNEEANAKKYNLSNPGVLMASNNGRLHRTDAECSSVFAEKLRQHVAAPIRVESYGKLLVSLQQVAHDIAGINSSECPICSKS